MTNNDSFAKVPATSYELTWTAGLPDSAGNPVFYFKDHANDQRITIKQKGVIEQVAEGKAVIMENANVTILPDIDPNY